MKTTKTSKINFVGFGGLTINVSFGINPFHGFKNGNSNSDQEDPSKPTHEAG